MLLSHRPTTSQHGYSIKPHPPKGIQEIIDRNLVRCSSLILTSSLHLLQSTLSLSFPAFLSFNALASQSHRDFLPHFSILVQNSDICPPGYDFFPILPGHFTLSIPFSNNIPVISSRPGDLGIGFHQRAERDVDRHIRVRARLDFRPVIGDSDGRERKEGLSACALDGAGGQDERVVGITRLVDDQIGQVFSCEG
jgi:hypothetical protein